MTTDTIDTLLLRGKALFNAEKFEEALLAFGQIAERGEDDPYVHNYIGLAAIKLGRFNMALANFTRAEEIAKIAKYDLATKQGLEITLTYNKAFCRAQMGEHQKAYEILQKLTDKFLISNP